MSVKEMDVYQRYYEDLREPGYTSYRLNKYRPYLRGILLPELEPRWVKFHSMQKDLAQDARAQEKTYLCSTCLDHRAGQVTADIISFLRKLIPLGLRLPTQERAAPQLQMRMDNLWELLHHNFSNDHTADMVIKGLVFQILRHGVADQREEDALFANCQALLEKSDVLRAMLTDNIDVALVTRYHWEHVGGGDDPERLPILPRAYRQTPEMKNHLFGRVLTDKGTPLALTDMWPGPMPPVGEEITISNFPSVVFFTLKPTTSGERRLGFSDLLSFRQPLYDFTMEEGPVYHAVKEEPLYTLSLILRLDGDNNHIRVYDHFVHPFPQFFPDVSVQSRHDDGGWTVETPGCELLLVYSAAVEETVTEKSIEASHAQSNEQWVVEWGAEKILGNKLLELTKRLDEDEQISQGDTPGPQKDVAQPNEPEDAMVVNQDQTLDVPDANEQGEEVQGSSPQQDPTGLPALEDFMFANEYLGSSDENPDLSDEYPDVYA